jgi:hypothetical protein
MNDWGLVAGVVIVAGGLALAAWYAWRARRPGIEAGL